MTAIKPIETVYNGYRFRSRLEARWAVFFDSAGIKYEYEPEGFELGNGIRYLPDFYLPDVELRHSNEKGLYVEVKGVMTSEDKLKIHLFSGMWVFLESRFYTRNEIEELLVGGKPILCVGNIPEESELPGNGGWPCHFEDEDYFWTFRFIDGDPYWCDFYKKKDGSVCVCGPDNDYMQDDGAYGYYALWDAYRIARQARFEHGEHGGVR